MVIATLKFTSSFNHHINGFIITWIHKEKG